MAHRGFGHDVVNGGGDLVASVSGPVKGDSLRRHRVVHSVLELERGTNLINNLGIHFNKG